MTQVLIMSLPNLGLTPCFLNSLSTLQLAAREVGCLLRFDVPKLSRTNEEFQHIHVHFVYLASCLQAFKSPTRPAPSTTELLPSPSSLSFRPFASSGTPSSVPTRESLSRERRLRCRTIPRTRSSALSGWEESAELSLSVRWGST